MNLNTQVLFRLAATASKSAALDTTVGGALVLQESATLGDGTGADEADEVYHDAGTVAGGGMETLDLAGALSDVFGETVGLARVKALLVRNVSDTTDAVDGHTRATEAVLRLGGGTDGSGASAFDSWCDESAGDGSAAVKLRAGGALGIFAGDATAYPVTAGSADTLALRNTGTAQAAYELIVVGATS